MHTTEETLRAHFKAFGVVEEVIIIKLPGTSESRGFGFVTYTFPFMVDRAQANRPHYIDGRIVESKRATPRNQYLRPETRTLFVNGLGREHGDDDLKLYFRNYGNILSIKNVNNRGFAFVEFDDYDPVDKAAREYFFISIIL